MRIDFARLAIVTGTTVAALACLTSEALAQPAPITYAGQGGARQVADASTTTLVAGDANSYGYGGQSNPRRGATIDLRARQQPQASAPAAPVEITPPPAQRADTRDVRSNRAQAAPEWLERERVGPPYQANGRWYVPTPEPGYSVNGMASWYGPTFHGQATASGEIFDQEQISAAHPTLPLPSLVQVTNLENGREIIVRVNDRGPFVGDRVIDLSKRAAEVLGYDRQGQARVNVRYLGPAPRLVGANGATVPASASVPAAPAPRAPVEVASNGGPASLLPPPSSPNAVPTTAPAVSQITPQDPNAPVPLNGAPLGPQPAPQRAGVQQVSWRLATPAPLSGGYVVQVGAFSSPTAAENVRAAVNGVGPAAVDPRQTANGQLYRVRLGPFATRDEAEAARRSLAQMGYGDAILAAR